jgi:3-methylcrotonyl-CoA carboxylase alpha subunit
LYAEDPEAGFLPGSGKLERLRLPDANAHVRIDSGVIEGDTVTIFYDPMIAKLIVWDRDRPRALARLRDALAQCDIAGPKSNIDFLERLARHPVVAQGTIDTSYLDRHLDEFVQASVQDEAYADADLLLAAATVQLLTQEQSTRDAARNSADPTSPWAIADGWRLGHGGHRSLAFMHRGQRIELRTHGSNGEYRIEGVGSDDMAPTVSGARLEGDSLGLRIDGRSRRFTVLEQGRRVVVHDGEKRLSLEPVAMYRHEQAAAGSGADRVTAPMPGRVVMVRAAAGDKVEAGQEVMVIEAMKMELSLKAPRAGIVKEVRAASGDFVEADAVLVALEA